MKFAYADPPYLGCAEKLYGDPTYDDPEAHRMLIERLCSDFQDGWAMSLHEPSLRVILPMCPDDCRTSPWVKPFASFKPGVGVAYAWEPVIWRGGRRRTREQETVRDWCSANITLQRGLTGAKPRDFCVWLFSVLNIQPGDELVDIFPGTGAVTTALREFLGEGGVGFDLFAEGAAP